MLTYKRTRESAPPIVFNTLRSQTYQGDNKNQRDPDPSPFRSEPSPARHSRLGQPGVDLISRDEDRRTFGVLVRGDSALLFDQCALSATVESTSNGESGVTEEEHEEESGHGVVIVLGHHCEDETMSDVVEGGRTNSCRLTLVCILSTVSVSASTAVTMVRRRR